ncbi:hypothetical protein HUG17_2381 [Dermatophagoides farinae]|uniref:Uncharacterized protein n=2 Tax=Dermatophagoides farinae TaxID=6954 RepID=A0A9D4PAJ9_DERFA|nr:hypothetical protein HUG17_2381 [Dermatophagoides farinae]
MILSAYENRKLSISKKIRIQSNCSSIQGKSPIIFEINPRISKSLSNEHFGNADASIMHLFDQCFCNVIGDDDQFSYKYSAIRWNQYIPKLTMMFRIIVATLMVAGLASAQMGGPTNKTMTSRVFMRAANETNDGKDADMRNYGGAYAPAPVYAAPAAPAYAPPPPPAYAPPPPPAAYAPPPPPPAYAPAVAAPAYAPPAAPAYAPPAAPAYAPPAAPAYDPGICICTSPAPADYAAPPPPPAYAPPPPPPAYAPPPAAPAYAPAAAPAYAPPPPPPAYAPPPPPPAYAPPPPPAPAYAPAAAPAYAPPPPPPPPAYAAPAAPAYAPALPPPPPPAYAAPAAYK